MRRPFLARQRMRCTVPCYWRRLPQTMPSANTRRGAIICSLWFCTWPALNQSLRSGCDCLVRLLGRGGRPFYLPFIPSTPSSLNYISSRSEILSGLFFPGLLDLSAGWSERARAVGLGDGRLCLGSSLEIDCYCPAGRIGCARRSVRLAVSKRNKEIGCGA